MHVLYVQEELDNELFLHTTLLFRRVARIVMFRFSVFLLLPLHSLPTYASDRRGNTHIIV